MRGEPHSPQVRRRRAWAEDLLGGRGWVEQRCCAGGAGNCSRNGSGKLPRGHAQHGGCIPVRKGTVCIRVGRGPPDRHIISRLHFGEEGVNTSNDPLVRNWFDRPWSKQIDAVVAVRDNIVSWANHGWRESSCGIEGAVHGAQFAVSCWLRQRRPPSWGSSRLSQQAPGVLWYKLDQCR